MIGYYCHCYFVQGPGKQGRQLLGGRLSSYRGDTVLLEVGGHGRVAAQSLAWALEPTVPLHYPGATGFFTQHAAAARSWGGCAGDRGAYWQTYGPLDARSRISTALEHAAYVGQQVIEELWDALITWKDSHIYCQHVLNVWPGG